MCPPPGSSYTPQGQNVGFLKIGEERSYLPGNIIQERPRNAPEVDRVTGDELYSGLAQHGPNPGVFFETMREAIQFVAGCGRALQHEHPVVRQTDKAVVGEIFGDDYKSKLRRDQDRGGVRVELRRPVHLKGLTEALITVVQRLSSPVTSRG
jgi:hypothetical protein